MIGKEPNGAIAVYATVAAANAGLEALRSTGFDMRSVSVVGPGHTGDPPPPELDHSPRHSIEVAEFWALWGAVIGAGVGGAAISVPLIAAVVGIGPFAPVLAAVAVGATGVGALASALVGYGVHEAHALSYEHALRDGKVVVVAHADDLGALEDTRAALASGSPERLDTHGLRALRRHP